MERCFVELTLPERFQTLTVLPEAGNFATLKLLRKLREALAPSEEELEEFDIVAEDNQVRWNPQKMLDEQGRMFTKDIEIGKKGNAIIVEALEKLNAQQKLTQQHVSIYEKFVEPDGQET